MIRFFKRFFCAEYFDVGICVIEFEYFTEMWFKDFFEMVSDQF